MHTKGDEQRPKHPCSALFPAGSTHHWALAWLSPPPDPPTTEVLGRMTKGLKPVSAPRHKSRAPLNVATASPWLPSPPEEPLHFLAINHVPTGCSHRRSSAVRWSGHHASQPHLFPTRCLVPGEAGWASAGVVGWASAAFTVGGAAAVIVAS
jgi:hypothetical protein